jgi:hypothetical protein
LFGFVIGMLFSGFFSNRDCARSTANNLWVTGISFLDWRCVDAFGLYLKYRLKKLATRSTNIAGVNLLKVTPAQMMKCSMLSAQNHAKLLNLRCVFGRLQMNTLKKILE